MALQIVLAFTFKQQSIPTDWNRLSRGLARSALVSLLALMPALALSLFHGWERTQPVQSVVFIAAIVATILCWMVSLRLCRHALAREPLFSRTIGRLPGMRLPA
jgi:hypothetical protein